MVNRNSLIGATCGFFLLAAGSAQAVSYNFLQAIDTSYTGTIKLDGTTLGNPTGERGGSTLVWEKDGLKLTATSSDNVYLDRGGAGLGVCGTLTAGFQCTPSNDDNVTVGEWLLFSFDTQVALDLSDSLFKNANHVAYNPVPSGIWLEVDGTTSYNLGVLGNSADTYLGTYFKFWTESDRTQFYVSTLDASAVPEPATMLLFGTGLAGLAGYSRKKRDQEQMAGKV